MNKLAIFDLDGTLFDTKDVNYKAYCEALKRCGLPNSIDYQYYCAFCNGNNYRTFLPKIIHGISEFQMDCVHQEKLALYSKYLGEAKENKHLFEMIKCIRPLYKTALVTTASKENTMEILKFFGVETFFDFIITKEDVSETKPNPECFFKAIDLANSDIDNTVIFEDSEVGLKAAELSGAQYVKVFGYN